jgi:hypothetical protein
VLRVHVWLGEEFSVPAEPGRTMSPTPQAFAKQLAAELAKKQPQLFSGRSVRVHTEFENSGASDRPPLLLCVGSDPLSSRRNRPVLGGI